MSLVLLILGISSRYTACKVVVECICTAWDGTQHHELVTNQSQSYTKAWVLKNGR